MGSGYGCDHSSIYLLPSNFFFDKSARAKFPSFVLLGSCANSNVSLLLALLYFWFSWKVCMHCSGSAYRLQQDGTAGDLKLGQNTHVLPPSQKKINSSIVMFYFVSKLLIFLSIYVVKLWTWKQKLHLQLHHLPNRGNTIVQEGTLQKKIYGHSCSYYCDPPRKNLPLVLAIYTPQ
jgi:hypothetical protein